MLNPFYMVSLDGAYVKAAGILNLKFLELSAVCWQATKLLALLISTMSWAQTPTASINTDIFQVGKNWRWLYSHWNKKNQTWEPYYTERYTVIERVDKRITIQMTSAAAEAQQGSGHHKFVVDLKKCERAAQDPRFKNFTVELYTKSLSRDWELVSRGHPNLIFVEKFNCASPFPNQKVEYGEHTVGGHVETTFQIKTLPPRPSSWYFLDSGERSAIAASKLFGPDGQYKMEFLDEGVSSRGISPSPRGIFEPISE